MESVAVYKYRRAKLVAALRGGGYKQGRYTLRDKRNYYCCLGVACELSGLDEWDLNRYESIYYYGKKFGELPINVMEYYGFKSSDGSRGKGNAYLSQLNDEGVDFSEISDIIESDNNLWVEGTY